MSNPQVFVEVGQRFGRLVVTRTDIRIRQSPKRPYGWRAAMCRCDCGTEVAVHVSSLMRAAGTKSCGCIWDEHEWTRTPENRAVSSATIRRVNARPGERERVAGLRARQTPEQAARRVANRKPPPGDYRHGLARHPLYTLWGQMMRRCYKAEWPGYQHWGGRGIRVHGPWHDVSVFIAEIEAAIGPRPEGRHPSGYPIYTLDRIDNDGNYGPGNVRWATMSEQSRNRRRPKRQAA